MGATAPRARIFDLTAFHRPGATAAVYRTTADPAINLALAAAPRELTAAT